MLYSENLIIVIWLLLVGTSSFVLTFFIRSYALKKSLLDIPNIRSSHSVPTPRGGGVAIIISFFASLLILVLKNQLDQSMVVGMIGGGMLVGLVGFIDDHRHITARWRLLVHFTAAVLILYVLGGLPPLHVFGARIDLMWFGHLLATLYLVWLLNLYNFMDGIDGIASIEAITVCLGGIILYWVVEPSGITWLVPAILLFSVAGFLFWNFPKAKIFMGDAGSGFLGLMLGALSIQAAWIAPKLFWGWIILLGVFLVDATVTLIRRILRKEKFYVAHCSHGYQHAARQLNSHVRVSLSIGLINLIWLLPIAVLVALDYLDGTMGVIIAYIPLIFLTIYFKSGVTENNGRDSIR